MTLKIFKSGIHTTMGLAAVIAVGAASGIFDSNEKPSVAQPDAESTVASKEVPTSNGRTKLPQTPVDAKLSQSASVPATAVAEQTVKKDNAVPDINRPQFDVLRVEKNGAVVVAGNAVPNSQVDILKPDGTVIGQVQTGEQGDFALALKDILTPGNHVLGLRSTDADGVKLRSAQTGIVRIPEAEGDVLAMVSQDGEVSRILMKPVAFEPQQESISKRESLSPTPPTVRTEVTERPKTSTSTKEKTTIQHPVLVEAVEVEGRRVFVAGAVMQGELVRVYLDNVSIGTTRGTRENRFLLSKKFVLKPGLHAVRVDVINEKTGGVWSRAEVGLQHDLPDEILAIETDKNIGFVAHSREWKAGVKVASLNLNLRESVIDDKVLPKFPLGVPTIPQPSNETGILLDKGSESTANKLLYAHAFKSAVSNSTAVQTGSNFIHTGRAIIIKPGDSLWKISQLTYGDGMRYTTIFNANRNQIRDPNLIYAGQIFKIPEKVVQ